MAGLNKVMIIGRLGRDPEIRYSQAGTAITNFSVATSEQWVDKQTGQKQEKTEWHRIVVFGKQAENCEKYLSKGRQVYVEGKLQTSTYDKDGQTHYSTEIIANSIQFLGNRQDNEGSPQYQQSEFGNQGNTSNQIPSNRPPQGAYNPPATTAATQGPGANTIPENEIPF